jgi:probable H4MPT-linked C1 transfer pathway protein
MSTIGWDIGGAHLKLARVDGGRVIDVRQIPCPLWLGLDRLQASIATGLGGWPAATVHAVTMTGELTDLFPDRAHGVRALVGAVEASARMAKIGIYASDGTFLDVREAKADPDRVASANWHASARLAAAHFGDGLFADIGSTTTDLVPLRGGAVGAHGMDDAARLATEELIYRGVVRTPVMAVVQHVVVDGVRTGVMAEYFSSMADVYRLTGELPSHADQHPSADGRGKSPADSRARLARMIGRDAGSAPDATWDELARQIANRQLDDITEGAARVAAAAGLPPEAPVIGAGVGRFLALALARRLRRPYQGFEAVVAAENETVAAMASGCAPAAAVALLLEAASSNARNRITATGSSSPVRPPAESAERKPR